MLEAYICDAIRTPIGRYGGGLATVRADDLAAIPMRALIERNASVDFSLLDDVVFGCANQAGEDNRNVARMSALLAGLPLTAGGVTLNRLCGSGLDAVMSAARSIRLGEAELMIAGGVESMSRAPYVMSKSGSAYDRGAKMYDTTMGWRFVNKQMQQQYGIDSMPQTAENVAEKFAISRADQDRFALLSQQRAAAAQENGVLAEEIISVTITQRKRDDLVVSTDEHPRANSTLEGLSKLPTPFKQNGTVTAGNASGLNDGACAVLLASASSVQEFGLEPMARVVGSAVVGLEPAYMGFGPSPAIKKLLGRLNLKLEQMDVIELNEAFAAQALAVTRDLGLEDGAAHVNPNGGAIALGHPLGMSGARILTTAAYELNRRKARYALCSMCIGVGQGIAAVIERC
ncbi:MAG: 3-oxoadipyl-CoA thiolase [Gammaproteobacteria bacterium]